ncbi:gliding motility-associated-like protein [Chitinophaga dinghuensis]|uniref:Gliding motility-associated-like protein n=1 Tax=Chitinophaga dinghuensis TaxID=1539050 RepID=A0A327VUE0_9BACT|nr:Ig-like domain-containing protein [Chitinophaga dinghuensis]RAJ77558.1 gliding motility-associated-like protein [Chitinophaga dinghuensis]
MIRCFTLNLLFILFFCCAARAQFKGIVVNEFSQGDGGAREYFELVVVGTRTCTETTADIRGWIVDDQNGWYGGNSTGIAQGHLRFTNSNVWKNVPFGSIIVLYNANSTASPTDVNTTIKNTLPDDPDDSNGDGVYVIPIFNAGPKIALVNSLVELHTGSPSSPSSSTYTYPTTGYSATIPAASSWGNQLGLSNSGDAVIVTSPANLSNPFHSVTFGLTPTAPFKTPHVQLGAVAANKNAYLSDDKYTVAASWKIGNALVDETPGKGNSVANQAWIDAMKVNPSSTPLDPITGGNTVCVSATLTLSNTTSGGTWSSSDNTIATIDPTTGVVTGVKAGIVTITYTVTGSCGNSTQTQQVTVADKPATPTITGLATVCAGSNITLSGTPGGGQWTSSDNTIATVDIATGAVSGIQIGNAVITYTLSNSCGNASATQSITVTDKPTVAAITGPTSVCANDNITLTNTTTGGTWTSSDDLIATIDPSTGVVSGIAAGTVTITYTVSNTCGQTQVTSNVTVSNAPVVAAITGSNTVCAGNTTQLSNTTPGGTWNSSNNTIATVDVNGLVTGLQSGTATISYTVTSGCGNINRTMVITVDDKPSVAPITGGNTICIGATTALNSATTGGTWTSSNTSIATVDNVGTVTGISAGIATITYTVNNTCGNTAVTLNVTVNAAPIAAAISGNNNVCVGNSTVLVNSTPGGVWSSSDPAIATIANPSGNVTGVTAGNVVITYTVTNTCGTNAATANFTVNDVPVVAAITGSNTLCVNATTTLSNTTPGGTWSSGNNAVATVDNTGMVTGVAAGTAVISYTVTNGCGNTIKTQTLTVTDKPNVPPVTGTNTLCVGATTTLNNSLSGGSWSSNNTSVATIDNTGKVTAIATGMATMTYTVTNSCGTSAQTFNITVNDKPQVNAITGTATLCVNATAQFSNSTTGGTWGSSNSAVASINASGLATALSAGTTVITYTVTNSCGATVVNFNVTVNDVPVVAAISGNNTVCLGATTTLTNTTPGGAWSSSANTIATISNTGLVTGIATGNAVISYAVTNSCGTTTKTFNITVAAPPVVPPVTGPTTVCKNNSITLSNTATGGTWTTSNAAIATISNAGVVTGMAAGNVVLTYTLTNACGSTPANYAVTVNDIPVVPAITGAQDICINKTLQLNNATAGGTWSSSNNSILSVDPNGLVTGKAAGSAIITYTVNSNGCTNSAQVTMKVEDFQLSLTASGEPFIAGLPLTIQTTANTATYNVTAWSPATLFSNQSAKQQTITPAQPASLLIKTDATSATGCTSSATLTLNILPNNEDFFVPNAFTPNGDGKNDVFRVYGSSVKSIELQVYTQWGEMVYSSNDITKGWDGTFKGRQQPVGVYVYALKATMQNGAVINKKGAVNLIR